MAILFILCNNPTFKRQSGPSKLPARGVEGVRPT